MLNIFNFFLFLMSLWGLFMIGSSKISLAYFLFGIVSSILISFTSFKANIFNKNSELLYLSVGFYKHFVKIYLRDFFKSLSLLFRLAFKGCVPNLYQLKLNDKYLTNKELLIASINMKSGIFYVGSKGDEMLIYAVSKDCFEKIDIHKLCLNLRNINDDSLV